MATFLGFDSTQETIKALIEEIIPFGNVVSSVISAKTMLNIGQQVTIGMIFHDVIKTLMASFLFTFAMRFVNLVMGITSKSIISYFFAECTVAVALAILCSVALEKLNAVISAAIGQFLSNTLQVAILALIIVIWMKLMLKNDVALSVLKNYLFFRKLLPSIARVMVTYVCVTMILLIPFAGSLGIMLGMTAFILFIGVMGVSVYFDNMRIN